jgi:hypothetical protein
MDEEPQCHDQTSRHFGNGSIDTAFWRDWRLPGAALRRRRVRPAKIVSTPKNCLSLEIQP